MSWTMPGDYAVPTWKQVILSMQSVSTPSVLGTYLAMEPINYERKRPFVSKRGLGETTNTSPVTPGQARTAFDMGWVHDSLIDAMAEIARSDGREWRAPI